MTAQSEEAIKDLSKRETELIECISQGLSRSEIAEKLNLSVHTYDGYRKSIRTKLHIKSQADWARILLLIN